MTESQRDTLHGVTPPPPPLNYGNVLRVAVAEALAPVVTAWDQRSADMLDVLKEAADSKRQVRTAVRTIKVASWLGVLAMVLGILGVWTVLESERDERRKFRDAEQARRVEAVDVIVRRVEAACHR